MADISTNALIDKANKTTDVSVIAEISREISRRGLSMIWNSNSNCWEVTI